MVASSIPTALRERASVHPNGAAITYIDYEQDWAGVAETLTWSQLYRRMLNVAEPLRHVGATGDRAVILAPQGIEYVVGFLGALQAGRIAVPLPVPHAGAHDERTISVLSDTSPAVILTTSGAVDDVRECAQPQPGQSAPSIVELDLLDLDSRQRSRSPGARPTGRDTPETAYLQYTSGSTRTPAGVMVSNKNVFANFEQIVADFFAPEGGVVPPDLTVVSWLPLYHDMGLLLGAIMPILAGVPTVLTSPVGFLQRPARWIQLLARNGRTISAGPNFAFELAVRKTSDDDMDGLDLAGVHTILNGSERVHPATLKRFAERFGRFNFAAAALRPAYGMAEATVYIATRNVNEPPEIVDVTAKAPAAFAQAIALARPAGTVVVAGTRGVGSGAPGFSPDVVVFKELRVLGALGVDATAYRAALDLLVSGRYPFASLPRRCVRLEGAEDLLATMAGERDGVPPIHGVLTP